MQYKIEFDKRAIKFIFKQPQAQKERLCHVLRCQPGDIMEYVEDVDQPKE